jgi:MFS family permease
MQATPEMTDKQHPVVTPSMGGLTTIAVLALSSMTVMANATISPSLPGLRAHFAAVPDIETLAGLILTLPSLAVVLTAGLVGWLTDKVDRQKLLLLSGLLYGLGGTSGLWVDSLTGMLVGRTVLGVGVAGTMVLATTWAADLWQGEARTRFLGRQGAAMSAGGVVVLLLGGALATLHWRGAFAAYLLVAPVTLLALSALAPHARRLADSKPTSGAVSPTTDPFPWHVFTFVGTLAFLFMVAFYAIPTRLPFLLGEAGVTNPFLLSAVISLVTVAALPGALAYGKIRHRAPAMVIFSLCWGCMGLGMVILATASGLPLMALGVVVIGLGLGLAMPNHTAYFMEFVPSTARGRASGLLTTAFFAGQFASPLVLAPLVRAFGLSGSFKALGGLALALACFLALMTQWSHSRRALP